MDPRCPKCGKTLHPTPEDDFECVDCPAEEED